MCSDFFICLSTFFFFKFGFFVLCLCFGLVFKQILNMFDISAREKGIRIL